VTVDSEHAPEIPDSAQEIYDSAREMIEALDIAIIPITAGGKAPLLKDWPNKATRSLDIIAGWLNKYPDCNLGAVPGERYVVVDIDPRNGGLLSARRIRRDLPRTRTHQTGGGVDVLDTPGSHLWYRLPDSVKLPKQGGKIADGIDFKTGNAAQVLIPGSKTDRRYRLSRPEPALEIPAGLLQRILGQTAGHPARSEGDRPRDSFGEPIGKGARDTTLVEYAGEKAGMVSREQLSEAEGLELLRLRWEQAEADPTDEIEWDKVKERFYTFLERDRQRDADPSVKVEDPVLADGFLGNAYGNMQRWLDMAQGRVRWVDAWAKWIVYRDGRWVIDPNGVLVLEIAKETVLEMRTTAAPLPKKEREELWGWANRSSSMNALKSMCDMARGETSVYINHEALNGHPMLFNVQNGTIALGNSELVPHKASDLITMQAPVVFEKDAGCPLWTSCLQQWIPDADVQWFLQKTLGSGLSGIPVQHLFINHGSGGNGKGVFFGIIHRLLGSDYYVVPHATLLTVQTHKEHDTVKADLYGSRIAVASETAEHDRLNEASIKELTGGDVLSGRRMREDPWSFLPSHSLFLHTNYRPRIRGTDEGIWRRIFIIPWTIKIPDDQRDPLLIDKLMKESSGILNWLLDGCIGWQEEGFNNAPAGVRAATDEYKAESDIIGRWMRDCEITFVGPNRGGVGTDILQTSFEMWALGEGLTMINWKVAKERLLAMGCEETRGPRPGRVRSVVGVEMPRAGGQQPLPG